MKKAADKESYFFRYLPYSLEDEKLGMVCTTAGSIFVPPNTAYPPNKNAHPLVFRNVAEGRTLPEFQLVYISDGRGVFCAEGKSRNVASGSMLLLLPGVKHFYKPLLETGWHEYWVGFIGTFFNGLVNQGILSKERLLFEIGLHEYVLSIFSKIFDEVRSQRPLYQIKVGSLVFSLLAEILSYERRKDHPSYSQQITEKAKYLIETSIDSEIDITSIAQTIGISASRLNEIFKTYTSMTPYQYYIQIKIDKACRLLEQENISIKEAAFKLGFKDQYYFSRLFSQKTGVPPSRWKNLTPGAMGLNEGIIVPNKDTGGGG
ncbi:MAG: AraC family transcriptional regulator [Treponema sp.]|jgi:AraC-like DNA-binding protein|nr:AraC family transcriptional regulator [Treponema sp.]